MIDTLHILMLPVEPIDQLYEITHFFDFLIMRLTGDSAPSLGCMLLSNANTCFFAIPGDALTLFINLMIS